MGDSSHWQRIRSPAAAGARETETTNDAQALWESHQYHLQLLSWPSAFSVQQSC
jgi:hypothetical protein